MSANVRPRWLSRWTLIGTVAAIALLVAIPSASASAVAPGPLPIHVAPNISLKGESARWDGKNLSTASTAAHAFTLGVNQRSLVVFTYDVPLGGPNVTTARMQAIYFGAVISTDQVSTHTNLSGTGSGTMNWTLGTFTYLLAGLYLLTASLVDSNGTTVWSESFYMQASAPYHVGSGLIIFLIVLALVELYSIATVGRSARKRPKALSSAPPTPWQQPSSTAEGGAATPSGETPPSGSPSSEGSP